MDKKKLIGTLVFASVLLSIAVGRSAQAKGIRSVNYEPKIERLSGVIVERSFPGPPDYNSIAEGDKKETCWLLKLREPVNVVADQSDDFNEAEKNVKEIQLVLEPPQYKLWRAVVGKASIVTLSGTLFHAHTGHHHREILMAVQTLKKSTESVSKTNR